MKLVFISDTHSRHDFMEVPDGDVIFHTGDFSKRGRLEEVRDFLDWFSALPHRYKVFIAGNHDFMAEREPEVFGQMIPDNVIYLNDSGTNIEGIPVWGSPIQPWFYDWAFNRQRGAEIREHWKLIPENTQILLVHGPPYGILDIVIDGRPVGCRDLGRRILELPELQIAAFGHIHEAYGTVEQSGVRYINASMLDVEYHLGNKAIEVEYPLK
jgi:Icc-related predicted phosphoesterase